MPVFGSIKRRKLIQNLHKLGFTGPYVGGNHQYMVKGTLRIFIPNPHQGEISKALLAKILQQAAITRDEWESL